MAVELVTLPVKAEQPPPALPVLQAAPIVRSTAPPLQLQAVLQTRLLAVTVCITIPLLILTNLAVLVALLPLPPPLPIHATAPRKSIALPAAAVGMGVMAMPEAEIVQQTQAALAADAPI